MPTLAQRLREDGMNRGEKKGKWEVVKNALAEGLPIKTIEKITGFPSDEIMQMKEKMALS